MNMEVLSKYDMMTVAGSSPIEGNEVRWPRPKRIRHRLSFWKRRYRIISMILVL
jgi:hypothetical protein